MEEKSLCTLLLYDYIHCLSTSAGSVSAAVSADSVEEEVFENERFARGGALSGQVGKAAAFVCYGR